MSSNPIPLDARERPIFAKSWMRFFIWIKPVVHGATSQQIFPLTDRLTLTTTNGRTIERWKKAIPRYVSSYMKKVETQTRRQPSLTVKASREPQNPVWNQGSMEASSLKEEKEISFSIQWVVWLLFGCSQPTYLMGKRKDCKRKPTSSEAQVCFASSHLLLRQICNNQTPYKMTVGWFSINLCLFRQLLSVSFYKMK